MHMCMHPPLWQPHVLVPWCARGTFQKRSRGARAAPRDGDNGAWHGDRVVSVQGSHSPDPPAPAHCAPARPHTDTHPEQHTGKGAHYKVGSPGSSRARVYRGSCAARADTTERPVWCRSNAPAPRAPLLLWAPALWVSSTATQPQAPAEAWHPTSRVRVACLLMAVWFARHHAPTRREPRPHARSRTPAFQHMRLRWAESQAQVQVRMCEP